MSTRDQQQAVLAATEPVDWTAGTSRLAGAPDLPDGIPWPETREGRPLAFIVQLDLASLPNLGERLPRQGHLWTFVDLDPDGSYEHRILFSQPSLLKLRQAPKTKGSRSDLVRTPIFELRQTAAENETRICGPDPDRHVAMRAALQRLGMGDAAYHTHMSEKRFDEEVAGFCASVAEWAQVEGQRLDRVVRPKLEEYRRRCSEVEESAQTFRTLMVLGSEAELDWCWGDAGELHIIISEEDLRECRFDRTFASLESALLAPPRI